MITKNDCILLISDISTRGTETTAIMKRLLSNPDVDIEVLRFINEHRPLDVAQFYEQLRYNYNHKKSKLYINIVKDIEDTNEVLTTLSALLTQILLYSKKCSDREMFLKHSRAEEISKVLTRYFKYYDLQTCLQLLRLIKLDLKALESVSK
jgi:hypothetical protein